MPPAEHGDSGQDWQDGESHGAATEVAAAAVPARRRRRKSKDGGAGSVGSAAAAHEQAPVADGSSGGAPEGAPEDAARDTALEGGARKKKSTKKKASNGAGSSTPISVAENAVRAKVGKNKGPEERNQQQQGPTQPAAVSASTGAGAPGTQERELPAKAAHIRITPSAYGSPPASSAGAVGNSAPASATPHLLAFLASAPVVNPGLVTAGYPQPQLVQEMIEHRLRVEADLSTREAARHSRSPRGSAPSPSRLPHSSGASVAPTAVPPRNSIAHLFLSSPPPQPHPEPLGKDRDTAVAEVEVEVEEGTQGGSAPGSRTRGQQRRGRRGSGAGKARATQAAPVGSPHIKAGSVDAADSLNTAWFDLDRQPADGGDSAATAAAAAVARHRRGDSSASYLTASSARSAYLRNMRDLGESPAAEVTTVKDEQGRSRTGTAASVLADDASTAQLSAPSVVTRVTDMSVQTAPADDASESLLSAPSQCTAPSLGSRVKSARQSHASRLPSDGAPPPPPPPPPPPSSGRATQRKSPRSPQAPSEPPPAPGVAGDDEVAADDASVRRASARKSALAGALSVTGSALPSYASVGSARSGEHAAKDAARAAAAAGYKQGASANGDAASVAHSDVSGASMAQSEGSLGSGTSARSTQARRVNSKEAARGPHQASAETSDAAGPLADDGDGAGTEQPRAASTSAAEEECGASGEVDSVGPLRSVVSFTTAASGASSRTARTGKTARSDGTFGAALSGKASEAAVSSRAAARPRARCSGSAAASDSARSRDDSQDLSET
jgi:hypothetical protein